MKSIRGFALGLALGIAAAIATVGLAQSTKPVEQGPTQKTESMMSCCCHGDSCATHGDKEHAKMQMKEHSGEGGCCCCGGDSCDMQMKMKEKAKSE
jgi:hypothetical protein